MNCICNDLYFQRFHKMHFRPRRKCDPGAHTPCALMITMPLFSPRKRKLCTNEKWINHINNNHWVIPVIPVPLYLYYTDFPHILSHFLNVSIFSRSIEQKLTLKDFFPLFCSIPSISENNFAGKLNSGIRHACVCRPPVSFHSKTPHLIILFPFPTS